MAEIRTNMSKEDIVHNMLEIACYLSEQDAGVNEVNVKVRNLNMHFEAWSEEADADREQMYVLMRIMLECVRNVYLNGLSQKRNRNGKENVKTS